MSVPPTVLVAGIGNIFFADDGYGPAVIGRLAGRDLPPGVEAADYGIRGVHLAFDLLDGRYPTLILVDAVPMGEAPGTVVLIEVDGQRQPDAGIDAHSLSPAAVLACVTALGGSLPRTLIIGCQPASVASGMGLSPPVAAALDDAVRLVLEVAGTEAAPSDGDGRAVMRRA